MNSKRDNERNAEHEENFNEKFERTLEHLKAGYSNAQEIIRFVDTKTSFLTGAATLTTGFILEAARQYAEMSGNIKQNFAIHPYLSCVLISVGQYALFFGGLCIWCCVLSLIARPPVRKSKRGSAVLFPFYQGSQPEQDYITSASQGLTRKQILKEYEAQIWNVGLILQKKVVRHRWASIMLLLQLAFVVLGGIVVLLCLEK